MLVFEEVVELRIDGDNLAVLARHGGHQFDQFGGHNSLVVVFNDDAVDLMNVIANRVGEPGDKVFRAIGLRFGIDADHMLVLRDHPGLDRRRPRTIHHDAPQVKAGILRHLLQGGSLMIVSDQAHEDRVASERGNVVCHIGSASEADGLRIHLDDRDGGFGGNPVH